MASELVNSKKKIPNAHQTSVEYGKWLANPEPGEEIVITGVSGRYPESNNIHEFRDNLLNKKDMITDDSRRWHTDHPEIPQRTGKIFNLDKFDAGFFGVHYRQVETMDPMLRVFMEKALETVMDAGIHPSELEGTNTGIFLGSCFSETEKHSFYQSLKPQQFGITGCTRSMIPNRVSYYLKLKGPSYVVDTACSSSLYALEHAYRAIRNGECDKALVGGTNMCLHPVASLQFSRLGVLSNDGACKVFDQDANGYARAEAVVCVLLEKSRDARRIYGEVIHAKINCDGYKEQGITFPSSDNQKLLLEDFYKECTVSPYSLNFLEAHGTGTQVGDPEEIFAIDEVFTKERDTPLLIGSVKSNMGHSEPSAGICSVSKVIVAMETGYIPPNINFNKPKENMVAIQQGRLKVVVEKTLFPDNKGLIGINSFGFGGGNCHVLVRWNKKQKINHGQPKDNLPRLVCISGRVENAITSILDDLANRKLDAEYVRLLHQLFSKDFPSHLYRGYSVITKSKEIKRSLRYNPEKPSLYLAFGKLETNCLDLGKTMSKFPIFATSLQKMHDILAKKALNVTEIILNKSNENDNHFLASIIVQIGLINIIKALDINPNGIFGHSVGELLCAYFSGTLSLEKTVLCAYEIDLILKQIKLPTKSVLGKDKKNEANNGKNGIMENFSKTKSQLLHQLRNIIPKPKEKCGKWLSHKNEIVISAEYIVEALSKLNSLNLVDDHNIPNQSVILELGNLELSPVPDKDIGILSLNNYSSDDIGFLEIIGSLYEFGFNPQIDRLYPIVDYPVSRGTPMISPLIQWNHTKNWFLCYFKTHQTLNIGARNFIIALGIADLAYNTGHEIDGRTLFPAIGYLDLVWKTLAQSIEMIPTDFQVVFENCKFSRATNVSKETLVELAVVVQKGTGNFEISENNTPIVSGRVFVPKNLKQYQTNLPSSAPLDCEEFSVLTKKDIYKELRLRGYNYKGAFRSLVECDNSASVGKIKWDNNWVTFIDAIMQMKILQTDTRLLYVPTFIQRLTIDPKKHLTMATNLGDEPVFEITSQQYGDVMKCGGIEISGIHASSIGRRRPLGEPVLEKYEFVPNETNLNTMQSLRVIVQIILENALEIRVKAIELIDESTKEDSELLSPLIHQVLGDLPLIQPDITIFSKKPIEIKQIKVEDKKLAPETDCLLIVATKILQRTLILQQTFGALSKNGFVLSREDIDCQINQLDGIDVILTHTTATEKLVLFKKSVEVKELTIIDVSDTKTFKWLPQLQKSLKNDENVIVYSQNQLLTGILGLVNCVRRESSRNNVKCFFIADDAPKFDPKNIFYSNQMKKNCAINVYKNSSWGTYRHLLLEDLEQVECEHCYVNVTVRGDLSSLKWIQGPLTNKTETNSEKTLVNVYFAAINFRDVMTASGRINADVITTNRLEQECVQGLEFSGRDLKGQRVMGIVNCGALSTIVLADNYLLWPVPNHWSLEDAVTVPVVYSTVLYALVVRGRIKRGQSILIHAGSGGVGQAAISIALYHGCTVFTTVGTQEKRDFLKKRFPQLRDSHIGNSRDISFETMIEKETNGRGVDLVLNSLAEEKLVASLRCLAFGGKFLEIGKFDLVNNNPLRLLLLNKEASFHGIMLDRILTESPSVKMRFAQLFIEGIENGSIRPLVSTSFKEDEIEQAMRFMASGKHVGKVLINIRIEEKDKIIVPKTRLVKGIPRYYCDAKKSYIITGGLGGFGLELADWLILRGARNVILTSRTGVKTGYQSMRVRIWRSYGTNIHISTANITTKEGCVELIKEANKIAPIDAIFNLAVVLKDALLDNQNIENFVTSFEPKAYATKYLDETTRILCPNLRNFVIFSSVSCGRGNPGQTNYGMANSVMERICEKRKNDGYPALAVEWGAIGEVGLVAEMQEEQTEIEIGGTLQQRISSCLDVLDKFLRQNNPIVSSMVVAEKRSGSGGADNVVDAVANILGIRDMKTVSLHSTLAELGMDSMTAVEIKQTLEREFEVYLTAQDIRSMTFARLYEIQAEKEAEDGGDGKKKQRILEGIEMLLGVVPDETTCYLPSRKLPTNIDETATAPTVFIFPGLDGVQSSLESLSKNLNCHAIGLQFRFDNPEDTIEEMAKYALSNLRTHLGEEESFNIVCYSYGTNVALEVVSILESKGYLGNVIIIDGAPEMLKSLAIKNLQTSSDALVETEILSQLMSTYIPAEVVLKNKEKLIKCKNFDERMDAAKDLVPKDTPYSPIFQRQVAVALRKRIKALVSYQATYSKIKSPIKLFKPQFTSLKDLPEDYKLSEISEQTVEVKVFYGNHATILESLDVANDINIALGVAVVVENAKEESANGSGEPKDEETTD